MDPARIRREGAQALVADLTRHGIDVPTPVLEAGARVTALTQRLAATPAPADHRARAVDTLVADPDANVADLVAAEVDAHVAAQAIGRARAVAGAILAEVLDEHHADIVAGIRSTVFEPALATLELVATKTGPDDTTTSLLRAGRTKDANTLAGAALAAENLSLAIDLRNRLYRRKSGITTMRTSVWHNPADIPAGTLDELTGADRWVAGIRAGGRLWLGTLPEVEDAEREHRARLKADQLATEAAYHEAKREQSRARRSGTVAGRR